MLTILILISLWITLLLVSIEKVKGFHLKWLAEEIFRILDLTSDEGSIILAALSKRKNKMKKPFKNKQTKKKPWKTSLGF